MLSPKRRLILTVIVSLLVFTNIDPQLAQASEAPPAIPEDSTKPLPLAIERSISTYVPSIAAPGNGLAINIIYPQKPRYKDGAPIAIIVPGGDTPNGLNICAHAAQVGFVELRFSFPGGGLDSFKSGGYNDYRGPKSQLALHDILLFAAGKGEDFKHRKMAELLPVKLSMNNIGIIGWSNGGNIVLVTMEKYANSLSFIRWLALCECPLGSLFFPPSLGSTHDFLLNNHYRQGSAATGHCLIDFRKLAFQADIKPHPGVRKKLGEPDLPGVIYFDDNKNNQWNESTEFAFNYCVDKGLNKQIYPPDVAAAMERLKIFQSLAPPPPITVAPKAIASKASPKTDKKTNDKLSDKTSNTKEKVDTKTTINDTKTKIINAAKSAAATKTKEKSKPEPVESVPDYIKYWPRTIATLEESENYFQERDGSLSIPALCNLYPNLLVTILASQVDHLQTQPDHPHIVLQYNAWLENGAHWVRLNPESIYLASLADMNKSNFVQNAPNAPIEATNITDYLEPKGILKDYVFVDATIAELADRCRSKNVSSPLTAPIYTYSNGLPIAKPNTTATDKAPK